MGEFLNVLLGRNTDRETKAGLTRCLIDVVAERNKRASERLHDELDAHGVATVTTLEFIREGK